MDQKRPKEREVYGVMIQNFMFFRPFKFELTIRIKELETVADDQIRGNDLDGWLWLAGIGRL